MKKCLVKVFEMNMLSQKIGVAVLSSIVISLASMGLSTYSATRSIQATPTMNYTTISLGQKFNWTVAEVVEIQGNLYAYLGYEWPSHHFARWQNGWMELSYHYIDPNYLPRNFTLAPYILQVYTYITDLYVVAQFYES